MKNNLKTLFIADVHMSNKLPHSVPGENGLTDRFEDQLKMWEQIRDIIEEGKGYDAVFILGDLFDKSLVDPVTLSHTVAEIVKIPVTTYILSGNHDISFAGGGRSLVEVFGSFENDNVEVIGEGGHSSVKGVLGGKILKFHPFSFKTVEENSLELTDVTFPDGQFNIALVHNSILGAEHEEWTCDSGLDPEEDFVDYDKVYAGHFHKTQRFSDKGMYIGAPMHHHFGDVGRDAGVWSIEFKNVDGEIETDEQFIPLDLPKFYKVKFNGVDKRAKLSKGIKGGDYLRIEVEATKSEWLGAYKKLNDYKSALEKDRQIHVSLVHKPVYYHEERLENGSELGSFSLEKAIVQYVKSEDVNTDGMDEKVLKEFGKNVLEMVRSSNGN
jgi:DNA repair exonuclease SbcCD nuclease subunit